MDSDVEDITDNFQNYLADSPRFKLNGREIRNVVFSANVMALSEGKDSIGWNHIRDVLRVTRDFQEQLKAITDKQRYGREASSGREIKLTLTFLVLKDMNSLMGSAAEQSKQNKLFTEMIKIIISTQGKQYKTTPRPRSSRLSQHKAYPVDSFTQHQQHLNPCALLVYPKLQQ